MRAAGESRGPGQQALRGHALPSCLGDSGAPVLPSGATYCMPGCLSAPRMRPRPPPPRAVEIIGKDEEDSVCALATQLSGNREPGAGWLQDGPPGKPTAGTEKVKSSCSELELLWLPGAAALPAVELGANGFLWFPA